MLGKRKEKNKKKIIASIFFFLAGIIPASASMAIENIHFSSIENNAINQKTINAIVQGKKGFLWIGTEDGLFCYNGYDFKQYYFDRHDSTSIGSSYIRCMHVDSQGGLWIGTWGGGLNRYDYTQDEFIRYKNTRGAANCIAGDSINDISEDNDGNLWLAVRLKGLDRFNIKNKEFFHYKHTITNPKSLSSNDIDELLIDHQNNLWIGCWYGGLNKLNLNNPRSLVPSKAIFQKYLTRYGRKKNQGQSVISLYEDKNKNLWIGTHRGQGLGKYDREMDRIMFIDKFQENQILCLLENKKRELWIGTNSGLIIYNLNTNEHVVHQNHLNQPHSLSHDRVLCIMKDNSNVTWLGTQVGLSKHVTKKFKHYKTDKSEKNLNNVMCFEQDNDNNLYVGNWISGIKKFIVSPDHTLTLAPSTISSISRQMQIWSMYKEQYGDLWIGTFEDGLYKFNAREQEITNLKFETENVQGNRVPVIYPANSHTLLIGTWHGLYLLNTKTNEKIHFTREPSNPNSLSSNMITSILKDHEKYIWIGTREGGINIVPWKELIFNEKPCFIHFEKAPGNETSLSNNYVNTLIQDSKKNIWIGTEGGGLNHFVYDRNPENASFSCFTEDEGLPSAHVRSILEDDQGHIWISSSQGLSKMGIENKKIDNYTVKDGLQHMIFNTRACYKDKDGFLCFGGKNGFNYFHPDSIKYEKTPPKTYVSKVFIMNEKIGIGEKLEDGRILMEKSLFFTKEIKLSFQDKVISFEFVALDYMSPEQNKYMYMLEGFDQTWHHSSADQRRATYTNLDPGRYTFKVKSSNSHNVWNEKPAVIHLSIAPPWWKTWWAFTIYLGFVAIVLLLFRKYSIVQEKLKNDLVRERLEKEKIREVDEIKSKFFMNISHEVRTPISLIMGPLEKLMAQKDMDKKNAFQLEVIHRNAKRLLGLINQFIDFRKLELGQLQLEARKGDIVEFTREMFDSFQLLASQKNIDYKFKYQEPSIITYFDHEKVEKVLANLISNAFKFTPEHGKIRVRIKTIGPENLPDHVKYCKEGAVYIKIQDNGIGIPENKKQKIFNRFYRIEHPAKKKTAGVGIGLSLAKELMDLHHGRIELDSETNKGSNFKLYFPLGKSCFAKQEIIEEPLEATANKDKEEITETMEIQPAVEDHLANKELPLVLLVEDNIELRTFIREEIKNDYNIIEAKNGEEALNKAKQFIPDLVLSDIMMPVMDGITLSQKLKADLKTSHIPIILLTAKSSEEDNIEGLETGADEYIVKPFNMKVLSTKIKNLIGSRAKLREIFDPTVKLDTSEIITTPTDREFLQKSIEIVNQNLSNVNFGIDDFANKIGVSRSLLYIKLRAVTNKSVSEFIRTIRLKKAAQLLEENKYTIGEIIDLVGFNNRSYFTRCFRKQYGKNPSEYVQDVNK